MKILVTAESFPPIINGAAVATYNTAVGHARNGHDVRVVVPSDTGDPYEDTIDGGAVVHRTRSIRLWGSYGKATNFRVSVQPLTTIRPLITRWKPDVVHSNHPLLIDQTALTLAKRAKVPVVATNHVMPSNILDNADWWLTLLPQLESQTWKQLLRFLNRAHFVTSPAQRAIDLLEQHGLKRPHRVVSNGVDLVRFNPRVPRTKLGRKLKIPAGKPVVVYVGRLDEEKRMDVWVDAIPLVRREVDAHFMIGGRGIGESVLKKQATRLGVRRNVTFAGFVPDKDLPAFYRLGSAFAIASPAELQSIVTLQALAAGLPVVVADAAALPELCRPGKNGYRFKPGDPADLARQLVRVLKPASVSRRMGKESRRIVEAKHDIRQMPLNYERIYRKLLRAKAAAELLRDKPGPGAKPDKRR